MKKLFLLSFLFAFAFIVNAQTLSTPTAVTPDATITGEYYKMLTLDTTAFIETANYIFRVKGDETLDFKIGLYTDRLSGTAEGRLTAYGSLNGVNYIPLADSISWSGVTADVFDTETIELTDYNWPYLRLKLTQSDTASVIYKPYIYAKY